MAFFSRRILDLQNGSFFVAPSCKRRQLLIAQFDVHRLGDEEDVNIAVIPVPFSVVRSTTVLDSSSYKTVMEDLSDGFGKTGEEEVSGERQNVREIFFGKNSSSRLRLCSNVSELSEVRMDGIPLKICKRIMQQVQRHYGDGSFSFVVLAFRQKTPVSRIHLALTVPLIGNRLFVPLCLYAPRGIPYGERTDICVDESPHWKGRLMTVYSVNTCSAGGESLEYLQRENPNGEFGSGCVYSFLPAKLEGDVPFLSRRLKTLANFPDTKNQWLKLSSVFVAFLRIESSLESGNVRDATSTFQALLDKKPSSTVFARYAEFCASQGDLEQAKKYFHKSIAANQLNPIPYNVLGKFLVSTEKYDKASNAFRKALELNLYDESSLLALAKCLTREGYHSEEAEQLLRRAALLNQEQNPEVQARLETITEKPTGMSVTAIEKQKALEVVERKETVEHVSTYLDYLFSQKKALFPSPF